MRLFISRSYLRLVIGAAAFTALTAFGQSNWTTGVLTVPNAVAATNFYSINIDISAGGKLPNFQFLTSTGTSTGTYAAQIYSGTGTGGITTRNNGTAPTTMGPFLYTVKSAIVFAAINGAPTGATSPPGGGAWYRPFYWAITYNSTTGNSSQLIVGKFDQTTGQALGFEGNPVDPATGLATTAPTYYSVDKTLTNDTAGPLRVVITQTKPDGTKTVTSGNLMPGESTILHVESATQDTVAAEAFTNSPLYANIEGEDVPVEQSVANAPTGYAVETMTAHWIPKASIVDTPTPVGTSVLKAPTAQGTVNNTQVSTATTGATSQDISKLSTDIKSNIDRNTANQLALGTMAHTDATNALSKLGNIDKQFGDNGGVAGGIGSGGASNSGTVDGVAGTGTFQALLGLPGKLSTVASDLGNLAGKAMTGPGAQGPASFNFSWTMNGSARTVDVDSFLSKFYWVRVIFLGLITWGFLWSMIKTTKHAFA